MGVVELQDPCKVVAGAALAQPDKGFGAIGAGPARAGDILQATDITRELLDARPKSGPVLPCAHVKLLKGAVNSFMAWQNKYSSAIGVVLGRNHGDHVLGSKIIANASCQPESLIGHEKVKSLCGVESLFPCGLILGGDKGRETIQTMLEPMLANLPYALCVFVAWHSKCQRDRGREIFTNFSEQWFLLNVPSLIRLYSDTSPGQLQWIWNHGSI